MIIYFQRKLFTVGVFDKLPKQERKPNSTKGFYFGAVEAEIENVEGSKLLDYFDDYLDIMNELENGKFIFIGRKGVGKSAIAKYIKDTSDESDKSYATILRIDDLELEQFIQLPPDEHENKERLFFEWLILVNIVKQIVSHECGSYTLEYGKLKRFLEINSGVVNVDSYQVIEKRIDKGGEVNFGVLKHAFGGIFKNYFNSHLDKAPFYKLIPPLRDIVKIILDFPINKDLEFWLLFDDLDVKFNVKSTEDKNKIMQLIRVAKLYNNDIFRKNKAKVLIFLREDIRDAVITSYNDSAKIFLSSEIVINWYNHKLYLEYSEEEIALKKMANKRIALNFEKNGIKYNDTDPWETLFKPEDYSTSYQFKSSFKYILDFTFYRPRDIITLLNTVTNDNYFFPLSKESVKQLLNRYIRINNNEIKSELKLYFSDEEIEVLYTIIFPFVLEKNPSSSELVNKIDSSGFSIEASKVFDILVDYSLIGYVDKSETLYFNFRDNSYLNNIDRSTLKLTLPKILYHNYRKIY